jgi:arsenite/tail-anchored protein-transporting ATPase
MRVLLFTGKGGVGKTTAAAATAALAARRGLKTLLVTTDAAGTLPEVLGAPVGAEPTEVADGLAARQVDTRALLAARWDTVQGYLLRVLDPDGDDAVAAEELTVLPGAEEVLALLALRDAAAEGRWDVLVCDCAPTGETLRLLALPESLPWYLDRLLGTDRRLARVLRPVLGHAGVPLPDTGVLEAVDRLRADLADARALLTGPDASVRLVLTPESAVVAEARRAHTALALHGYRVDGVLANRVFPDEGADDWRAGWVAAQSARLAEAARSFAPAPLYRLPYLSAEPTGVDALAGLASEAYGDADPYAPPPEAPALQVARTDDGFTLSLPLPLADRDALDLVRAGDAELVVTVGADRRVLALPSALRRCDVTGARYDDGRLHVDFRPDPDRWRSP